MEKDGGNNYKTYNLIIHEIGLGGGCHWCTEGVFQSLKGVTQVDQGWIRSADENQDFSEAVIIHFDPEEISLETLIEIHLLTHSSSSKHLMRKKYRSAVYYFNKEQKSKALEYIHSLNSNSPPIITLVIPFEEFKINDEKYLNYYQTRQESPFCENFITPKILSLMKSHGNYLK